MWNSTKIFVIVAMVILGVGGYAISVKLTQQNSVSKGGGGVTPSVSSTAELNNVSVLERDGNIADDEKVDSKPVVPPYLEYSKSTFGGVLGDRLVLFFYASWCPTCRPADASFRASASKIPKDVTVIRVNYNDPETDGEEKDLAKKYDVTYQHTFVQIDAGGNEITKWNGGQIDELIANVM